MNVSVFNIGGCLSIEPNFYLVCWSRLPVADAIVLAKSQNQQPSCREVSWGVGLLTHHQFGSKSIFLH